MKNTVQSEAIIDMDRCRAKKLLAFLHGSANKNAGMASADSYEPKIRNQFFALSVSDRFDIVHSLSATKTHLVRLLLTNVLRADPSSLVRHEAAFVLGCVGGADELPAVCDALGNDPSFLVRHEAAMAIAEIGGTSELSLLKACLSDANQEVVISCQVAIVRIEERNRLALINNSL